MSVDGEKVSDLAKQLESDGGGADIDVSEGEMLVDTEKMSGLARELEESVFLIPVFDQTGLSGNFAFYLRWDAKGGRDKLKQAMVEQLGLELVSSVQPVEMLVVEKAR
jgi:uncharacterized protein (TIGR03435 family)